RRFLGLGLGPIPGSKPPLDSIGVVAAGIHPEHDLGGGVVKLPADDDLIPAPRQPVAGLRLRLRAAGGETRAEQDQETGFHRSSASLSGIGLGKSSEYRFSHAAGRLSRSRRRSWSIE